MIQLCYLSFSKDGLNVEETIKSIKDVSLKNNVGRNTTGLLVYSLT